MSHLTLKIQQHSTRSIKLCFQHYFKFSLFHPWGWWVYRVNCWIFGRQHTKHFSENMKGWQLVYDDGSYSLYLWCVQLNLFLNHRTEVTGPLLVAVQNIEHTTLLTQGTIKTKFYIMWCTLWQDVFFFFCFPGSVILYDNEKQNWRILTNKEIYASVKKTYYNRDNKVK